MINDTARPVPSWAAFTARAIPWALLPWCLWRLPFAVDFTMGTIDPAAPAMPWWGGVYVVGLSVLSEGLALLTLGLVRGWGETFPAWVPVLGARRVPPWAAIVPGALGGLVLTVALWGSFLRGLLHVGGYDLVRFANGWWEALATVCVAPGMLWGPAVLALTWAYHRRRRA
ncbi:hypothetical protein Lfu02_00200 [Longispora fulva]|uniref:DUF3995 domain-containing protein n=1 Tax=Longispora fulva TaxID=619741 RepID=A0A8J7KPB2_9ACTN|nr:hypothetical protein [Longispora fulva]MBG6136107.1 hypothetical protein [Longispora fulva]GIG55648.1 hypothetical protein Lfu02_00200 [Longispora fulva]